MTLVHMLHTLADTHDAAGRPTTADAMREAAGALSFAEEAIKSAVITFEARKRMPIEESYAIARLRDALKEIS